MVKYEVYCFSCKTTHITGEPCYYCPVCGSEEVEGQAFLACEDCGETVWLDSFTNECPNCGALYNRFGEQLEPRANWDFEDRVDDFDDDPFFSDSDGF